MALESAMYMRSEQYSSVYSMLRKIPKGKVTTYGTIAKKLALNPRFVGRILSKNEHQKIYPCYKVVQSDGTIGGYTLRNTTSKRSLAIKKKKLVSDGVRFVRGKIPKEFILYRL
ncbi:MAG: MGMT family protein [Candidatus Parvarchaeota archaeon]|nr:MGMT family protein [Candidatus Parvarchaeota archaeon]